jgi:Domain of unknown function (DUF4913)
MTPDNATPQSSPPGGLPSPAIHTEPRDPEEQFLGGPDDASEPPAAEPMYFAVEDWVTEYFLPMFRRTLGGEYRWCGQWWRHGEAISRLTALWHSWEVLRLQPGTGIALWYRDHLDHQLPILMGARGPFYQCTETTHRGPRPAGSIPPPGDWWDLTADTSPDPETVLSHDGSQL